MDSSQIILVARHFPHHGRHSGYDRLCHFMPDAQVVHPPRPRVFRGRDRLRGLLARYAPSYYYDLPDVIAELKVAALDGGRGATWHFLYGEDQLWACFPLARLCRATVFATIHQPENSLHLLLRSTPLWRELDGLVAVGRSQLRHASRHAPPERLRFIPHGVDTEFFTPGAQALRSKHSPPLRVLIVGRWLRDLELVTRASAALPPHLFSFRYIGPVDVATRFAGTRVNFESGLDDEALRQAYRDADLLWLPLIDATANNALLEALACGLPVLAPKLESLVDYAAHGGVQLHNVSSTPEEELALFAQNPGRLENLRQQSRPASEHFAWPVIASALRSFYAEARSLLATTP